MESDLFKTPTLISGIKSADVATCSAACLLCAGLLPLQESNGSPTAQLSEAASLKRNSFLDELCQESVAKFMRKLLSTQASKTNNLTIEGSCFGLQHIGIFDGCVTLLQRLVFLV
jgi:hypothetical protein